METTNKLQSGGDMKGQSEDQHHRKGLLILCRTHLSACPNMKMSNTSETSRAPKRKNNVH